MSLGEAFIEVRADLRPFGRDLHRNVRPIVEAFEQELNNAIGRAVLAQSGESGRRIGDHISRGMKNSIIKQFREKNAFIAIAGALGSALDDGISALPTEVKAAIVAGIILATPAIVAFLTGAIVAGIGAGVAGLGVLLGAQFQDVQDSAINFFRQWRRDLVESASAFGPALLNALAMIDSRLRMMRESFRQIFDVSATFVEPLTRGILDMIENIVESIRKSVGGMQPFVEELAAGFEVLGHAIGMAIEILVSTGDDGVKALRDLIAVLAIVLVSTAAMFALFTKVYGVVRDTIILLSDLLGPLAGILPVLAGLFRAIDERSGANRSAVESNGFLADSFTGLIAATNGEIDSIEEYTAALKRASDAAKSQLELNISWEESLDRIAESLRENGKTLDITTEKGRNNVREFIKGLEIAEKRALERVQRGELTSEQAVAQYQREIEQLRVLANQAGIADENFNALFDEMITTAAVRISAEEMGITGLTGEITDAGSAAERLAEMLRLILTLSRGVGRGGVAGALTGAQDGGIFSLPQTVNLAEAGPEVVIPLTKPERAASLLRESGLSDMMTQGPSQILVFIGNEQLDSRVVRIVERGNSKQAQALSQGPRRF